MLRYDSGETVHEGDLVIYFEEQAVVTQVILPDTEEARQLLCPEGGIVIEEQGESLKWGTILLPAGGDWEELVFLRRQSSEGGA